MKLDDIQLILLSRASQREDHGLEVETDNEAHDRAIRTLLRRKLLKAVPKEASLPLWRTGEDAAPESLVITPAGLKALGSGEETPTRESTAPAKAPRAPKRPAKAAAKPAKSPPAGKTAKVVSLLQRSKGATVAEIIKATGWQPHSVRAALTGLRKKGMTVERTDTGTYRIG